MTSTQLEVEDLVTGYGKQRVVQGVSLRAEKGCVTCLFGPNGSGKSTVLKGIAGALPVWEGSIRLGETDLTGLPVHEVVRRGVIMMPQGGGVFPRLTVVENLRMGGYSIGDPRVVEQRVEELIGEFESLRRRRNTPAGALSGGEQMMAAIARALMPDPDFILLDEPSAGLAPSMVHDTIQRVKALRERGVGIIMVEQNIREALPIADRLYILAGGKEKFSGTPEEIRDDRQLMELYMGG